MYRQHSNRLRFVSTMSKVNLINSYISISTDCTVNISSKVIDSSLIRHQNKIQAMLHGGK